MDIIGHIKEIEQHFSVSEKKVAQYLIENLEYSTSAAIGDLASKIGVSNATITRFAKTLDCKNVRELKLKLAQSVAVGDRFLSEKQIKKKDIPAIYKSIHEILNLNVGLFDEQTISRASELIVAAKHVLIFGVGGGSTIFAQECLYRFFRLDIQCNAHNDPMLMRMAAATINKNDVVLCLSLSGYSPDVIEAAKIAKDYGAHIITICPTAPLSKIADIHLPILTDEKDYIFKPSASRYVMLATIDILASELAVKNQKQSREKLRRLKYHLDEHRQTCKRAPLGD